MCSQAHARPARPPGDVCTMEEQYAPHSALSGGGRARRKRGAGPQRRRCSFFYSRYCGARAPVVRGKLAEATWRGRAVRRECAIQLLLCARRAALDEMKWQQHGLGGGGLSLGPSDRPSQDEGERSRKYTEGDSQHPKDLRLLSAASEKKLWGRECARPPAGAAHAVE